MKESYNCLTAVTLVSVHRAVCEQPADRAGAVQTAWGRAAGSTERNARQGARSGEGERADTQILCERDVQTLNVRCFFIQRSSCLPDENNMAALQEEVKQMKLRELETLRSFREMQDSVTELNQRWQVMNTYCCCIWWCHVCSRGVTPAHFTFL